MIAADPNATAASASRFGSSATIILRALENRATLAALELEEMRNHLTAATAWGLVGSIALLLAGATLTAVVAAIFWDTPQRVTALLVLGAVEIAVTAGQRMVCDFALASLATLRALARSTREGFCMPPGNSHADPTLTPEARKHLALVACTLDRLDLVANFRPPTSPFDRFTQLISWPWFDTLASVAERMFPRKLRLLIVVWRTWTKARRNR